MSEQSKGSAGVSRRLLLATACAAPLVAQGQSWAAEAPNLARPFPLASVRLKPSIFLDAVNTNTRYLKSLEPDRLLHSFRSFAGLSPKGEIYGGWESMGLAGHSLGHYLSACALTYAQTGDEEMRGRARY
ncbi:MAG: beta-L-arabinofuranosidase domain-containing protein, partial [Pseudomonadota bacterium]